MKEWYLLNAGTRPNITGGYENDTFRDYKDDAFFEALQTDIASTVQLYNYDRSESTEIRCIIQDNLSNTQLKSMERSILAPIGTLKAGMYILYENVYWLISGYPGNNDVYEKATLILCQRILKWQDNTGKIIERPANIVSAAKYDTGTSGNSTIVLSSNNFTIWIPDDDESATLEKRRIFIDRNYTNPKKVYKITRSDDALYLFGEEHGGILSFIADKDELNLMTDRPDLGLCDYHSPTDVPEPNPGDETPVLSASISGGDTLRCGRSKTWMVTFKDGDGNEITDCDFKWNVASDFVIIQAINKNKIQLRVDDEDCIGSSFLLQITNNNRILTECQITIIGEF